MQIILNDDIRQLLRERYDGTSKVIDELAQEIGVDRTVIKNWACRLKITCGKRTWRPAEIAYLERAISHKSLTEIAHHLNRSIYAIRNQCVIMGIGKKSYGYTTASLAEALGYDHTRIIRWIKSGRLKATRRQINRADCDFYYISDAAVKAFICEYPNEIKPTKKNWIWLVDVLGGGENGIGELAV